MRVQRSRGAAWIALVAWLAGVPGEPAGAFHHDGIDAGCEDAAVVHDPSKHRVEAGDGDAGGTADHCHACHFPRSLVTQAALAPLTSVPVWQLAPRAPAARPFVSPSPLPARAPPAA